MNASAEKPLVEFLAGDKPRIEVFAAEKRDSPVPRYLYGQFAEHLGSNVYHGMWAQILGNTGFEPGSYFTRRGEDSLESWLGMHSIFTGVPELLESYKNGVACFWGWWGKGDVTYSASDDRINSDSAQKIEIRTLNTPEAGVLQPIFLPTHRTGRYELSLWVKSTVPKLHVAIRDTDGTELGGADLSGLTNQWKKRSLRLSINRDGIKRGQVLLFTIGAGEPGTILLDQCMLFPSDQKEGFDPEVIAFLKESKLPLLRFPGGNFVSGYHWKDGVGPVDKRPMRTNPAWNQDEPNHVGTDEWLAFCRLVECEPLICVNAGNGTPEEAADWVEYCNGGVKTKFGALRAKNGHPEPYNVKLWEIGNELWGDWQIGHCTAEEYARRYAAFYDAMKARDPSILFIANGQYPGWNAPTIEHDAKIVRSLSLHCLMGDRVPDDAPKEDVYRSLAALSVWLEGHMREIGDKMAAGGIKEPRVALTELQLFTKHWEIPNNRTQTETIFYSGVLNGAIRLGNLVEMVTRSALVNHGAGLRRDRQTLFADPVAWAHRIYSTQSGRWPVRLRITGPRFSVPEFHGLPGVNDVPYLDAVALLDDSGKELNLLVTNRHPTETLSAEIALTGFSAKPEVCIQSLAADYMAGNNFENPEAVKTNRSTASGSATGITYAFPPSSLTCLVFSRAD